MGNKMDQTRHDAAVLPRIRDLEARGLSLRQIAEQLQADGFPTPSGRGQWSYMAVQRILDRAAKPSPGGAATGAKIPAPVTITVNGRVHTNVPVAHQAGGQVTIQVAAAETEPETKPAESPTRDSLVQVVDPATLYALPPAPGETVYELRQSSLFRRRV